MQCFEGHRGQFKPYANIPSLRMCCIANVRIFCSEGASYHMVFSFFQECVHSTGAARKLGLR